jgi:hypothetical protein
MGLVIASGAVEDGHLAAIHEEVGTGCVREASSTKAFTCAS